MAATLMQAIHDQWEQDAALSAARPRLLDDNPMSGLELTAYAILEGLGAPERPDDFEGGRKVDASWTFRVWGTGTNQGISRASAETVAALIRAAFDRQTLDVEGHSCLKVRVSDTRVRTDEARATPGRLVHEVEMRFVADLHRRGTP